MNIVVTSAIEKFVENTAQILQSSSMLNTLFMFVSHFIMIEVESCMEVSMEGHESR